MRSIRKPALELMTLHRTLGASPDVSKRIYTIVDVINLTGLSLRQVRHWTKCGLLVPMYIATGAEGNRPTYYYSSSQVMRAALILEMCERGLSLKAVKTVNKNLKKQGLRLEESGKYLLTNGDTVCYASSPTEVVDILKLEGQMLLIPMYEPLQELHKKLKSRMVV